jgi:hypothetical protein
MEAHAVLADPEPYQRTLPPPATVSTSARRRSTDAVDVP